MTPTARHTARQLLDRAMSESQFQAAVIRLAHDLGWRVHHSRKVEQRDGTWRTPIQGDRGFVDLVLARGGVVLHPELKAETGDYGPGQREWKAAIGETHRLWRPSSMDEIVETLRGAA